MPFDPNKPWESSPDASLDSAETPYLPRMRHYLRAADARGPIMDWLIQIFLHLAIGTAIVGEFESSF